jgi:hypothetical protein
MLTSSKQMRCRRLRMLESAAVTRWAQCHTYAAPMDICMTFNSKGRSLIKHGITRQADASEGQELLFQAIENGGWYDTGHRFAKNEISIFRIDHFLGKMRS